MFSGGKASRPIYDALLKLGLKVVKKRRLVPPDHRSAYTGLTFCQIKPTTQTRIDFGFALETLKPTSRLIDAGGFAKKDRITHRIPITSSKISTTK
jgi:hypothetical protein